jgi:hypothetical protein
MGYTLCGKNYAGGASLCGFAFLPPVRAKSANRALKKVKAPACFAPRKRFPGVFSTAMLDG